MDFQQFCALVQSVRSSEGEEGIERLRAVIMVMISPLSFDAYRLVNFCSLWCTFLHDFFSLLGIVPRRYRYSTMSIDKLSYVFVGSTRTGIVNGESLGTCENTASVYLDLNRYRKE